MRSILFLVAVNRLSMLVSLSINVGLSSFSILVIASVMVKGFFFFAFLQVQYLIASPHLSQVGFMAHAFPCFD